MLNKITVLQKNSGQRLDKLLTEKLKNQTRSQIKKLIEQGLVLINNKPTKVHYFIKAGDKISITTGVKKQNLNNNLKPSSYNLIPNLLFENNNFLIIEKPIGLLVHPTDIGEKNTLVDWLVKKYPKIKEVGEQKYRAGIIHRLDKDVSGIMVVVKNNITFFHLKEQFKKRLVKKEYTALVYGNIEDEKGEINLPIGRNKDGQFVAHPRKGKEKFADKDRIAKTKYEVLEYVKDYTLLKVRILTGRTHQIRAHLSAIGHPIIGDKLYKPKKKFFHLFQKRIKVVELDRIFLHLTKIGFNDVQLQWQEFDSPLPKNLKQYLDETKN